MPDIDVLDSHIHFESSGVGDALVFLHGNPTSSHLWRNVIPGVAGEGFRALAPDLVGMGRSGKPAIDYTFADHARYLDAWLEAMGIREPILVGHDWGGALALDWAARHPDQIQGIVFFETILRPMSWEDLPASARPVFKMLKSDAGPRAVLDANVFIEQALPGAIADLSRQDHDVYRAPYQTPESRRPMLQWSRSMPIDGEPADVVDRVEAYDDWLRTSTDIPKLMPVFHDGPGLMGPAVHDWAVENIVSLDVVDCGVAGHHAPEDQPESLARAIDSWLPRHASPARMSQRADRESE
ncbi:haloalkane dehalogenase [Microbacterium elymi]|uniref:Haloalkane dehalogenase n=1 Tax=Microbacterium elymi TaxID=2909587 RepID=A0ABY5NIV9_9MICO|nr:MULTISPECIES: haloalkane dehalogenase [Microbacterium]UUT35100.1 haloalkane dehalogenase [Microbacterium elymi]